MDIKVTIEGVTPLLMRRFTEEDQQSASSGTRGSLVGDRGLPREQAEKALYRDEEGRIGIPGPNVYRAIVDAGKFHKIGRSKVTTQKSSLIPACVRLPELFLPITPDAWEVDTRPVQVPPGSGNRVLRHRPRFDRWALSFTLELDEDMMSPKLLRAIVDDAGKRIGLGDFRLDRKGPFGRFVVTRWEEESRDDH